MLYIELSLLVIHTECSFRYQIPDDWPYKEARQLFKEPLVTTDEELDLKWTSPDEDVITILLLKLIMLMNIQGLHTNMLIFICAILCM